MNKLRLSVALVALVVLGPAGRSVHGQAAAPTSTPTAVPTTTPTAPSYPLAAGLISQMRAFLKKKGSAHIALTASIVVTDSTTTTVKGYEDISLIHFRAHVISKSHSEQSDGTLLSNVVGETIEVGRRQASRLRAKNAKWSCHTDKKIKKASYDLTLGLIFPDTAFTVGPDTINGVAVWHLTAQPFPPGSTATGHADYYIAQSDKRLLRTFVTETDQSGSGPATTLQLIADYSKFGERVAVKLPSACRARE